MKNKLFEYLPSTKRKQVSRKRNKNATSKIGFAGRPCGWLAKMQNMYIQVKKT